MKIISIVFLSAVFCTNLTAQQRTNIEGQITGTTAAITVRLVSDLEEYTTTTDASGNYRFENIPDGRYLLVAGGRQASVVVENGQVSMARLADVVVVAANDEQTVEQVSKTIDVIGGQEMRDRADFSLVESLRTIPGFRIQQLGGFGRTANIKTRGLRNQDTALLIDGIRFRDASSITGDATPFLSDLTLTSISRIEVLRGSGSSIYGTNAIGGTIDLRTPAARGGTHGQISGAAGGLGLGRFRGNISHGTEDGRFGIGTAYSRTIYTEGIDGEDDAGNHNLQARIDAKPSTGTTISARVFFSDADVRLNTNPDTLGGPPATNFGIINALPDINFSPDENDPDSIQRSRFFSGQASVEHALTNRIVIGGYYQGLQTRRVNDNGPLGPGFQSPSVSIFEGTIRTLNAHIRWSPNDAHQVSAGYEFERESFGNEGRTPGGSEDFFTKAVQRSNTIHVQDLVGLLNERLQIAGSVRVQSFGLSTPRFSLSNAPYGGVTLADPPTAVTFDGSAAYSFRSAGTKLRVHAGNGYRVPSLYERFGTFFSTFGTPEFIALGDPFLSPEKTIAFDAGIEQDMADERVRLSATYFYTRLTDIIGFGNVVPDIGSTARPFGGYLNQKGGIARGGEFSSRFRPGASTDIFASYTYTNSDQREPQIAGSGVLNSLGIPDHQFTFVVTQRFGRFWVNFDLLATTSYLAPIFSGSTFTTYVYRFKGNRRGDLTAGYTFSLAKQRSFRVFGTIENVFDKEYFENGFRTAGVTARIGASFGF